MNVLLRPAVMLTLTQIAKGEAVTMTENTAEVIAPFVPTLAHASELANDLLAVLEGHLPSMLLADFLQGRQTRGQLDLSDVQLKRLGDPPCANVG